MASSPEEPESGPIVHIRADSDSTLDDLFAIALKPSGAQRPLQVPMRMRNLPASFWKPPTSGSKSPNCHSRESSLDNSYSPPTPQAGDVSPLQQASPQPMHSRAHSSPASLQQTLQQPQPQHQHLRQTSFDVGGTDLGPLPPGWEVAKTPQGQTYFMNHIMKTTQWEDPRKQIQQQMIQQMNGRTAPTATSQQELGALPDGWEQSVTAEGELYFINHVTKTTTWFDPRMPIHTQRVPLKQEIGVTAAQRRQQDLRLQRLEKERLALQQRQAELKKFMEKQQAKQQNDAAVAQTQEMLMRHNIADVDPFLSSNAGGAAAAVAGAAAAVAAAEHHNRQESADSGLGMGSNFNLGSIPEDITGLESMDTTDLDSTLTEQAPPPPPAAASDQLMPSLADELTDDIMLQDVQSILSSNKVDNVLTWL